MKHLLSALVLLAAASPAAADPVALDYRASDASCIDSGRFADEVSAKLGFVPWDARAKATIRVRVEREGNLFTGTFRNRDGRAKIIDGASCAEVTSNLAVTVAAAVDRPQMMGALVASAAPAPAAQPDDGKIPVTFASAEGRRVDISLNNGGGVGTASNGTQVAVNYFEGICTTPCSARLPRGRHYLMFQDPDAKAVGGDRFVIDQPTTITMHHKSRRGTRRGLFIAGAVASSASIAGMILGGTPGIIVGGSTLGIGVGLMISPLLIHDTFTTTTSQ